MVHFHLTSGQLIMKTICALTVLLVVGDVVMGRPASDTSGVDQRISLDSGGLRLHSVNHGPTYRTKRNMEALIRILRRSTDDMYDTKLSYTYFYNKLKEFVTMIIPKLTSQKQIQDHIGVVTQILAPDDSAFSGSDSEMILKKISLTSDLTELILNNVKRFLKKSDHDWFEGKKTTLQFSEVPLQMALLVQNVDESENLIDEVSSGIAGVNSGVISKIDISTLVKILELKKALES